MTGKAHKRAPNILCLPGGWSHGFFVFQIIKLNFMFCAYLFVYNICQFKIYIFLKLQKKHKRVNLKKKVCKMCVNKFTNPHWKFFLRSSLFGRHIMFFDRDIKNCWDAYSPKLICRLKAIPVKFQKEFLLG